jgi:hypothetical protein
MIHTCHNHEGWFAANDDDGSSTAYYPSRDALRQAITQGAASFTGSVPADYYAVPTGGEFELRNDPPKHKPREFHGQERTKQAVLITGLDCLPNQLDLFE